MDKSKFARSMAENLPELVLKLIFSFLHVEDLLSVQNVCTTWKKLTMNVQVWKHAPIKLAHEYRRHDKSYRHTVEDLVRVPYLHTVTGCTSNPKELLEALMKNVKDLRKADIFITRNINLSTVIFQNFIKTFKNLEFIQINSEIPAVIESLHILSNFSSLKALHLGCNGNLESVKHMCNATGDGFLALKKLEIVHMCKTANSVKAIMYLLRMKLNQLTELNLNDDFRPYFELISKSTKLEKLKILTLDCLENTLNFGGMTRLKTLTLVVCHSYCNSPGCLKKFYTNIIFPQSIEYLDININVKYPSGVVHNVISSLPNLRVLIVSNVKDSNLDQQLEEISNLPMLHTVTFENCPTLSKSGAECIMKKCRELRKFQVSDISFTDSTYEVLKNCKYLQDLTLEDCKYNIDKLIPCLASLKYLTNIKLYCDNMDSKGQFFSSDYVIWYIMQEHKKQYINV